MRNLIALPLLVLTVTLQSAVASQVKLLSGYADLPMLVLAAWALQERVKSAWHWAALGCVLVSFVSRLPWFTYAIGYFAIVWVAQILQRRVWQAPLLAMFSVTLFGVLIMNALSFGVLVALGTPLVPGDVVGLITLPSLLINMLVAIPAYGMMRDLARWVYPPEEYA
jgi:hypothetical protein